MCGIYGCCLKPNGNRKVALQKFKILGIYNIPRGKDATGVFVNGEIKKGIGTSSEFDDFIEKNVLPIPKENGIMLGHNRQGSWGYGKTIDQVHPFLINEDLVFTHNGTIKNVKELCEKYRVIESDFHVDSHMLGTILEENGTDVLEDYVGFAALAYTRLSEPNVLYLYHGASRETRNAAKLTEERPLYFLETKDGIFYSSLEESLKAIIDDDKEKVSNLEYNHVYKIENGKFSLDQSVEIFREETNVGVYTYNSYSGKTSQVPVRTCGNAMHNRSLISRGTSVKDENLVRRETLPINLVKSKDKKGFVYYHYGRYWEAPRTLLQGPVYLKKGGLFGTFDDKVSELFFFWQGAPLKGKEEFEEIKRLNEMGIKNWVKYPADHNYAMMLSKYTKHPITNINMEATYCGNYFKNTWYSNGQPCMYDNFTPKFANGRNYKIEDGYLVKLTASQRERTLHSTQEEGWEEIKLLLQGHLLPGVPGGGSYPPPFLLPASRSEITTDQKEKDELVWFFDISPLTEQDCIDYIGEPERDALSRYCEYVYKHDWGLTLLAIEMETAIKEVLDAAIEGKCSILDTITDKMDKQRLVSYYEAIVKSNNVLRLFENDVNRLGIGEEPFQSELPFVEDDDIRFYTEEEQEEDAMSREEIFSKVEAGINYLEDTQQAFAELVDAQDNDMAQECAKEGMIGVSNTLANLEGVLSKYREGDLVKRIKRIRENKREKDGVL